MADEPMSLETIAAMIERADVSAKLASAKREKKLLLGQIRALLHRAPDATILGMERLGRHDLSEAGIRVNGWVQDEIARRGLHVLRVIPGGKS